MIDRLGRWLASANVRYERVAITSDAIARGVAARQAAGQVLRPWFFDGPWSEGELIAGTALRAAADQDEPANLVILAEIVVEAAVAPDLDLQAVLRAISDLQRSRRRRPSAVRWEGRAFSATSQHVLTSCLDRHSIEQRNEGPDP